MENYEEVLNSIHFCGCEDILVGDVLHYSLTEKKSFWRGLKDIMCMIVKVSLKDNYKVEISGEGKNLTLFSNSYKNRKDHLEAFRGVTSIINNRTLIECSGEKINFGGLKYLFIVLKWNRKLIEKHFLFGDRMCLLRDLLQAYKDYCFIERIIKKNKLKICNVLVYCDVMPVDCFITQKFKKKGCKVVTFHHGAFAIENNAWAYAKSKSDFFLADSKASCDDAISVGYKGQIFAVGSPFQFNNVAISVRGPYKTGVFGLVMNSSADPVEDNKKMIETVQEYCRQNGKVMFVKFHPADCAEKYRQLIDESIVKGQYFTDITIDDFLKKIDVVILSTSTVIKTALSMNKPTLIFVRKGFDHKKFRGTDELKFSSELELEAQIKKIESGFEDVMKRQNAYLNVLGSVADNYRDCYSSLEII